jgi:hypothetical protein
MRSAATWISQFQCQRRNSRRRTKVQVSEMALATRALILVLPQFTGGSRHPTHLDILSFSLPEYES